MLKKIPALLIILRLLLGPVMVVLAYRLGIFYSALIFWLMVLGFLSDIFDGIIARKLNISTKRLRIADSQVDLFFWICTGGSCYILWPTVVLSKIWLIALLLIMEGLCMLIGFIKFRRLNSTHAYTAKFWGIVLFLTLTNLLLYGKTGNLFTFCIVLGVVADLENIVITLILKQWTHDVPTAWHAFQISKGKPIKRLKLFNG
jgi:phosphatidylglycerophosphate synthase